MDCMCRTPEMCSVRCGRCHRCGNMIQKTRATKTARRGRGAKAKTKKPDTGWKLCIATDGEVIVSDQTQDFDFWIPVLVKPWLSQNEAMTILSTLCDHYPDEGRWLFRSDPRSQIDLLRQFREAVGREAAKRKS